MALWLVSSSHSVTGPLPGAEFHFQAHEVVALVGGGDVAATLFTGHLESLLAVEGRWAGVRCRNFGWEGDTVFRRPRDVGFPPLKVHLDRAGVTLVLLQYGRSEALAGDLDSARFVDAYARVIEELAGNGRRFVFVTPAPFEKGEGDLPDLSPRNAVLESYCAAVLAFAQKHDLPVIDLFHMLDGPSHGQPRLTRDGLQLTPEGQALAALAFMRAAGLPGIRARSVIDAGVDSEGHWKNTSLEKVRQAVIARNRLWFNYWRPQNWAFLGGDRTEQPSSRDHRNPKIRWFPGEMEQFVPLIHHADEQIAQAASAIPEE